MAPEATSRPEETPGTPTPRVGGISRRRVLVGAAGGLVGLGLAGLVGYEWPHPSAQSTDLLEETAGVQRFFSRPDLLPPTVALTRHRVASAADADAPRFVFVAPRYLSPQPSQQGLMILDRLGRLVWFQPITTASPFDFNAQLDGTTPRLTWWQGEIINAYGVGIGELYDDAYLPAGTVRAGEGLRIDLHELTLTARGTAIITAYERHPMDLRPYGGVREGTVLAGHAQEVDLSTGKLLFDWNSLDHVSPAESHLAAPHASGEVYDYFHINAVAETPDGNWIVTARNTWALYKIDRRTGAVLWRLGGRRSDFTMGPHTRFYWQHDGRMPASDVVTVFDDGSAPEEEPHARGLLLHLDTDAMRVDLTRAYIHPAGFVSANQGSMQLLDDGRVFIGWGNQPYFSEFAPDGTLLLDGEFPRGVRSYRAFTQAWRGSPAEPPAAVTLPNPGGGVVVYVSWNGATEVARWEVHAGPHHDRMHAVGSQAWAGFETAIAVSDPGPYYTAIARDAAGNELGRTRVLG